MADAATEDSQGAEAPEVPAAPEVPPELQEPCPEVANAQRELQRLRRVDIFDREATPEHTMAGLVVYARVQSVYDGDSLRLCFRYPSGSGGNSRVWTFACRCLGIDTPETRPRRNVPDREHVMALAARSRAELLRMVSEDGAGTLGGVVTVRVHDFDKYGRLLITLYGPWRAHNARHASINAHMIQHGFAKAYDGSGPRPAWTHLDTMPDGDAPALVPA
jgi:endonuclease YncB( thermonuclease family)